jgi:hypothetical protein
MAENNHAKGAPAFLRPTDVARELQISLSAVYNLIRCGDLVAIDVAPSRGRRGHAHYRIRRQSLDDFVVRRGGAGPEVPTVRARRKS